MVVASAPVQVAVGGSVTVEATVANVGDAPATGAEVQIATPVGVTASATTTAGPACSAPAYVEGLDGVGFTCVLGVIAPGAEVDVEITLSGTAVGASGPVGVFASSSGGAEPADGGGAPNAVSFPFEVVPAPGVDLEVQADPFATPPPIGSPVQSRTRIANRGSEPASPVTVTQVFPAGFTFGAPVLERSDGGAAGSCSVAAQTVTCTTGSDTVDPLGTPGDRWEMVVPATPTTDGYFEIVHSAASPAPEPDPDPSPNEAKVASWRGLSYLDVVAPRTVAVGTSFTATVTWVGGGFGQYLSGSIPGNLRLDSISGGPFPLSCAGTGPVACSAPAAFMTDGGALTLNLTAIGVGGPGALSMFINSEAGSAGGYTYIETVEGSITSDVHPSFSAPGFALVGEPVTISGEVRTAGPTAHDDVSAVFELPVGSVANAARWGEGRVPCSIAGSTVTCPLGHLDGHDQVPVELVMTSYVPGPATVGVGVSSATAQDAPDPWPDLISLGFPVRAPFTDLGVTAVEPGRGPTQGTIHETVHRVTNHGSDVATGAVLTVQVPAGYSVVSAVPLTPPPVVPGGSGCSVSGQLVTCGIGPLANGVGQSIQVRATAGPPGPVTYLTAVQGDQAEPDPDEQPNEASLTVDGQAPNADVRASFNYESITPVVVGNQVSLGARVTSAGPSSVAAGQVVIEAPDGWRLDSVSAGGACTLVGNTATCGPRSLTTVWNLTIRVTPLEDLDGDLLLTASSEHPDPDPSSNTAVLELPALPNVVDLGVSSNAFLFGRGGAATHDVAVTNHGPGIASNVVLTGTLPPEATLVGASGGGFTCTITPHAFNCTRATMGAGLTATLILSLTFADVPGPLTYNFAVTSSSTEATPDVLPNAIAHEVMSSLLVRGFSGTVVDAAGAPVAGARVSIYAETDGFFPSTWTDTAADGTWTVTNLTPKTYRIAVSPPAGSGLLPEWYQDKPNRSLALPLAINGTTPFHVVPMIVG